MNAPTRLRLCLIALAAPLLLAPLESALARQLPEPELAMTHGLASGEVSSSGAVLWARASGPAQLQVEVDLDPTFAQASSRVGSLATDENDFTAVVRVDGLRPSTRYFYRVTFVGLSQSGLAAVSEARVGSFRTAPAATERRAFGFVVGGDLGGGGYCRPPNGGYALLDRIVELGPEFLIANGDMIYADEDCPAQGPAERRNLAGEFASVTSPNLVWTDLDQVRQSYARHWQYNRADPSLRGLLEQTPLYAQWGDREVLDDFGAAWSFWRLDQVNREGYANLVEAGRLAFLAFAPLERQAANPPTLYRSFRWGRDLELFLLDTRSFRSRNDLPDTPENDKTMLGAAQLSWLKDGLRSSNATWRVISSDVPLSLQVGTRPEMHGNDGWASGTRSDFSSRTGFERELAGLLRFLDESNLRNVLFVSTDANLAAVIRYELDADGDGDPLVFHELLSGPLGAAPSAMPAWERLDPSFWPRALYGEHSLFNFAYLRLEIGPDGRARLLADIRGPDGQPRPGSLLELSADSEAPIGASD